jgi:5-(carboxyamino)imidazole ribonucleotide synthase
MMVPPAIEMGVGIRVLAEGPDSSASIAAIMVGDYRDPDLVHAFASEVDVVTFDHEHVPLEILRSLVKSGVSVQPGPHALICAQDKIVMRERLAEIGAPIPQWMIASSTADVEAFLAEVGESSAIAKTPKGGYDGKGVRVFSQSSELGDWLGLGPVLLEQKVPFVREVAQLVARRPSGEMVAWPLVETRQKNGVCAEVFAPSPGSQGLHDSAKNIAFGIAQALEVTGVLAVEMFVVPEGKLLVNELAMRPHNSGHIFTELSKTSQFEQHLRAVLDWPLGSTELVAGAGVMANIFGGVKRDSVAEALERHPSLKVHDYGKSDRAGRKVGHLAITGEDSVALSAVLKDVISVIAREGD